MKSFSDLLGNFGQSINHALGFDKPAVVTNLIQGKPWNQDIPMFGGSAPVTPTPVPVATPIPTPLPSATPTVDMMGALVKPGNVTRESALPIIEKIINGYQPKTPDITPGWTTPLKDFTGLLADLSAQYGLNPNLMPLLAVAETQNLRPAASGTSHNNPFNTMNPGTQDLFQYPDLETALRQYASGIGEPRYSAFKEKLTPNSTFNDFIGIQNPSDNPDQERQTILEVARQLGL